MAEQTALTPLQLAEKQSPSQYSSSNPGGTIGAPTAPSLAPTGSTQAPAVISSTPATSVANDIKTNMNQKVSGATSLSSAKQNLTTTYDANGNMVKTGGQLPNGSLYQEMYSPGMPGYIPNPADVQKKAQQTADIKKQLAEKQNTLNLATAAGYSGDQEIKYDASGNIIPNSVPSGNNYNNPSSVPVPQDIDHTTISGQVQWYNQNKEQFDTWAKDQNMSQDDLSNIHYQAAIATQNKDAVTIKNTLDQFANGTYPLTPDQQAMLDSTKAQFERLISQQQLTNQSFENGTRILGVTSGRAEYAPYDYIGQVQGAINSGLQKVADLQSKEADALSTMKTAFETNNFKLVTEAYKILADVDKSVTSTMKDVHDEVVAAKKDARDFAEKKTMDDWTKYVQQKDIDFKTKEEALNNMKFTEQQKVDAANILHQKTQDQIAAAELRLKQETYDATYGFMKDIATGQKSGNFNPTDIPGVKKTLNNVYYFDKNEFSDKNQAQAAENVARKAGITILSDKLDTESMTNLTGALDNLTTLQDMFNKLAPSGIPGQKISMKAENLVLGTVSNLGMGTSDQINLLRAYNTNRDQLFKQIYALAGGHPRINSTEIEAAANAMPKLDLLNMDTLKGGGEKLTLTRKYLYNAVESIVPNANLPKSGDRIFNSTDELLKSHPDRATQAADLAKQGLSDDDIRTILNY